MTIEEQSAAAKLVAVENSKQGTFSFLERIADRNYPTEDVEIFLDEKTGHEIEKLKQTYALAKPEDRDGIEEKIDALREKARESRYIVHLEGVSTETYDKLVDQTQAEFPLEYNEFRNPVTFKLEREVIENEQREIYFRTHLWALFIRSVSDADGNVDDNISPEWVSAVLGGAPLIAQARINVAVQSLRMVTDWMDELQGEDFFPKS